MMARTVLAFLACLAGPAFAETVQLPCRPPVGQPFTIIHEQQTWSGAGVPSRITIRRAVRFEAAVAETVIVLGPAQATTDLTGAEAKRFALLYAPGGEQEARMRLDASGQIVAIDGLDRHWRNYLARLEKLAAVVEADGAAAARTRTMLAALAKADEATRIAAIDGEIVPFLRLCGQSVDGTAAPDGTLLVTEHDQSAAATAETSYRVARASGFIMTIERRLTPAAQRDRPLVEHWRLEPLAP